MGAHESILVAAVLPLGILALAGCRWEKDLPGTDTAPPAWEGPPRVAWGDVHNHTNLSHDGCENPAADCAPTDWLPAEQVFARAEANGLAFTAITDHAEVSGYAREADGVDLDIWERTKELIAAAGDDPVIGIPGYEWTGYCRFEGGEIQKIHRTVLLEDPSPCAQWRVPSCHGEGVLVEGSERYTYSGIDIAVSPSDLDAALGAAGDAEGCAPSRWSAFFHHPAQTIPAPVDWADPIATVPGDTVVEIASQHGSSECWDLAAEGCDWHTDIERHLPTGSIQYALQLGHRLGFVGGTDNHEANPGALDAAGPVRNLTDGTSALAQYSSGAITGILFEADTLTRARLFDSLGARHTVASSYVFVGLTVMADGADGSHWLPGDLLPAAAGPFTLTVALDDPRVSEWTAELVDPWGATTPIEALTLAEGEVRYVRIRAWIGEIEHRVWASPFFGG